MNELTSLVTLIWQSLKKSTIWVVFPLGYLLEIFVGNIVFFGRRGRVLDLEAAQDR